MSTMISSATTTASIPQQTADPVARISAAVRPVARWVQDADARLTCVWELQPSTGMSVSSS